MEIVTGLAAIAFGIALWNQGWWHWLLIGVGVLGLLPWFGAATILRKAETDPGVLESDPDRGRERGRRAVLVMLPAIVVLGVIIGYAADGWRGAATIGALMGISAGLGAWWFMRWSK
jgi:hypothetical protein